MTIYSWIYIILSIMVIIAIMKGKIDLISVCGACYILYTMYCIFGIGIAGFYRPRLSHKLYYYVYCQLLIIFFYLVWKNYRDKTEIKNSLENAHSVESIKESRAMKLSFIAYTCVIAAFSFVNMARIGFSGFASGKANVW